MNCCYCCFGRRRNGSGGWGRVDCIQCTFGRGILVVAVLAVLVIDIGIIVVIVVLLLIPVFVLLPLCLLQA